MKRTLIIFIIFALLCLVSIHEEILVDETTSNLSYYTQELSLCIDDARDDINKEYILEKFDDLDKFWDNQKSKLCMFANYDKLRFVDEALQKIYVGIKKNKVDLVDENLSIVQSFNEFATYILGFNFNNLF